MISEEQALQIAVAECERRDWLWAIPNLATWFDAKRGVWQVATRHKGKAARILVDAETGQVLQAGWIPR
jgi:uncharacterized membrane protein YkoI